MLSTEIFHPGKPCGRVFYTTKHFEVVSVQGRLVYAGSFSFTRLREASRYILLT